MRLLSLQEKKLQKEEGQEKAKEYEEAIEKKRKELNELNDYLQSHSLLSLVELKKRKLGLEKREIAVLRKEEKVLVQEEEQKKIAINFHKVKKEIQEKEKELKLKESDIEKKWGIFASYRAKKEVILRQQIQEVRNFLEKNKEKLKNYGSKTSQRANI